jgi:hypothetical protein
MSAVAQVREFDDVLMGRYVRSSDPATRSTR